MKVELVRIVRHERPDVDYTACIKLTDLDGRIVSLGFEGRYASEAQGAISTIHRYGVYTDCPVMSGDTQLTESAPLQVVRNLRDALMELNLGD
jgi:hypothetical protein